MTPLRLMLVDDHPVVRSGLAAILGDEEDLTVVAQASDGAEAVAIATRESVDVVLMDLRMPVTDGAEATARLRKLADPPAVLILTTYDTDADIVRAVEAGASGYLLKDAHPDQLTEAIRAAARGETVLAEPVAERLRVRSGRETPRLSARESEVLQLVAQGLSNLQIGERLYIGEATVKTHLQRSFAKLGVSDRMAAVTAAYLRGLIPLPPDLA